MVFEGFSEKIQGIMKKIRGKSRVTEEDVKAISREAGQRTKISR